jgi:hypothetical protein
MFRFLIRDVLWLTLMVAMALCWHRERNATLERDRRLVQSRTALAEALDRLTNLQRDYDRLATKRGWADFMFWMARPGERLKPLPQIQFSESDDPPGGLQPFLLPDPNAL